MARWVASLHLGAAASSSSTGFFGLVGVVTGVCVIVLVVGLCTVSGKDNRVRSKDSSDGDDSSPSRTSSKSPKKWMALSSKKLLVIAGAKKDKATEDEQATYDKEFMEVDGQLYSPVWQRTILMGERCEPPEFSGVILYDEYGNRVQGLPAKSPRAAAAPPSAYF